MLKNKLDELKIEAEKQLRCAVGRLLDSLDEETAEALKSAMASSASTRSIHKVLREDKISIDRNSITVARECFNANSSKHCKCGYGGAK